MELPNNIKIPNFEVNQIAVKLIKKYGKNAKKHPAEQIEKIKKSILEFGFRNPILLNNLNAKEIVAGHGRLMAAKELNMSEVPCISAEDLSDGQVKAFRIMDNKSQESEWDYELLKLDFAELGELGYDLELTGFEPEDYEDNSGEVSEDEFDTDKALEDVKYEVERGEVWQLGEHRLMCGDSTVKKDVIKLVNDGEVDLLLTDPPYGVSIVNTDKVEISGKVGFGKVGTTPVVPAKTYREVEGDSECFDACFLVGVGKTQIIFGANHFCHSLPENSHWIVWDKKCEKGADHNNFSDCELAWTNKDAKSTRVYRHLWSGLLRECERDIELKERVHPTQKPVGLMSDLVKDYSEGSVLDLFGGSGSTLIACEQLNRKCYMMELDPTYCSVIIDRWEKLTGKEVQKVGK